MRVEVLLDAIGGVENDLLVKCRQAPSQLNKWSVCAAIAACFCVVFIMTSYFLGSGTGNILPDQGQTGASRDEPNYIPNYSSPKLDELYSLSPYDVLLPKAFLPKCELEFSYLMLPDKVLNTTDSTYLNLLFTRGEDSSLDIKVSRHMGGGVLADPARTETYDLEYYYKLAETPGFVDADLPSDFSLSGLFKAEDLRLDLVAARVYSGEGIEVPCVASMTLICGDYEISYSYRGEIITAEEFYNMIISASYFAYGG